MDANGVGLEGVLIRDPIGNASTVGLQIGPVEQFDAIFDVHHRGQFDHLPEIRRHEMLRRHRR